MSKHLERDLERLENQILAQASVVEEMIQKACRAIVDSRPELVAEVLQLEQRVDQRDVEVEESCLKILALHQPVAVDLRRTATVLKINGDLERIADLAVNIAERAHFLTGSGGIFVPDSFEKMVAVTVAMVQASLDSLVNLDVESARAIRHRDDEVDNLNRQVIEELQDTMRSRSDLVEPALHLFSASRYVERIADHATNIADDVIYLVDGEIARHKHDLESIARPS